MSMSAARKNVLEALDVVADKGATKNELRSLIGSEQTQRSIGVTLWRCMRDDLIFNIYDRWYLAVYQKTEKEIRPYANGNNGRMTLPEYSKTRDTHTVMVYSSPTEETNIARIQMCINNAWFNVPFFSNIKICIGVEIPKWSPDQETNRNISVVRLIRKNGDYNDIQVPRGHPVTIAWEE